MTACPILSALSALNDVPYPLYVACSGGRDSLALAYGCYLLYQQGKLDRLPTLLHVHHGMQQANDDWARLVGVWADEHGFDWQILPLTLAKKTETSARTARYQALMGAMADDGVLLVAHHADDQAETVLMRLINGAGVRGLSGMRAWQAKTMQGRTMNLHRPLLGVSRQEITVFAHAHALPYVDDPTNETPDNARSLIRNDILPRLTALNPKVHQNIARTAHLMNDAHALISETVLELVKKCTLATPHTPFVGCLDIHALRLLSAHERLAVVRFFVQGDNPLPPSYQTVSDTLALSARTDGDHSTEIFWQGGNGDDVGGNGRAVVLCRYKNTLYRYHHELFLLLQDEMSDDKITLNSSKIFLKQNTTFAIFMDFHDGLRELFADKSAYIQPVRHDERLRIYEPYVDKDGQTQIGFAKLGGKKLYQRLSIPTWHRTNLWGLYVHDEMVLMMSMDKWWLTDSVMFHILREACDDGRLGRMLLVVDRVCLA